MAGSNLILLLSVSSMERDTGCDSLGCSANLHSNFLSIDITVNNYWLRALPSTAGSTFNGGLTPPSYDREMHQLQTQLHPTRVAPCQATLCSSSDSHIDWHLNAWGRTSSS
ncbi:hypothetical protein CY34DRAFT_569486 [Suillus luteus UH-Slu-Lm8-n1]|uniref:Unplaced genomic scaffold CY34scaffold_483, whole genome shotgun sequence n=1 Tax=Suillus luteus UH-Slu-Lm8-n1 TaxID=930992 RepID=A0A0D0AMV9_9AGAM|nr:hypothetical protein CY34DRAFT_569486 [Suillus luteus UH-Slu-Lm8-n1]